jgi:hypothetical protein
MFFRFLILSTKKDEMFLIDIYRVNANTLGNNHWIFKEEPIGSCAENHH